MAPLQHHDIGSEEFQLTACEERLTDFDCRLRESINRGVLIW